MAYNNPNRLSPKSELIHPLLRMRSENQLRGSPQQTLHRLRSMGQLSPPPDRPVPPLPPCSPLHPVGRVRSAISQPILCASSLNKHSRFSNYSSSSSGSQYSQDDEAETGRNTMLIQEQMDRKKVEFVLQQDSRSTPSLDDLSNILFLRDRLQEMGTEFTAQGKMLTYGNPPFNQDFEQMLCLGTMYDEQWNMFFTGGSTEDDKDDLWPDMKVLKRMLQNEGIMFGHQHKRLNYGNSHPKLIRLSDQYDVLREEWLNNTAQGLKPVRQHQHSLAWEETLKTPTNLGWKFILDDDDDELVRKKNCKTSSRLTIVAEEQSLGDEPGPTVQPGHWVSNTYPSPITPNSSASNHGSAYHLLSAPAMATATGSSGLPVGTMLHGSSPLQTTETASMLLHNVGSEARTSSTMSGENEGRRLEQVGVFAGLVGNERQRAAAPIACEWKEAKNGKKSKAVRKWLRNVLGRKKDDRA